MTIDYSKTIQLPQTDFPRRAGLAEKEPKILERWEKMDLYKMQRAQADGREKFILHAGPPFTSGGIHIGHTLSFVLKDIVCRSYQLLGFDAPMVPGFDCHGLPIEWKIEEQYRAKNKDVDIRKDIPRVEFIAECRKYAAHWIGVQSKEFQRIGVHADFKNPYVTMHKDAEAAIAREIHKFLLNGGLSLGSKPVMWSVVEQTALAEAEIEYKEITSDTVFVKFPVKSGPKELQGASVVIWTTTPWTLPGNRAVAYGADIDYIGFEIVSGHSTNPDITDIVSLLGKKVVIAECLYAEFKKSTGFHAAEDNGIPEAFWRGKGSDLKGVICHHPLHGKGYDFDVPLLEGDFVTTDTGTGFVHIAPGHGEDDYRLGLKYGIAIPQTVAGNGTYFPDVPLFAGAAVYMPDGKKGPANKFVMNAIAEAGNLVAKNQIRHSYPHSWRSKAPVIFRNTPQWFISMEKNGLRQKALDAIRKTRWIPKTGENRIAAMVEQGGDWNVSRQRLWGVPLSFFVDKKTNEPLRDEKVLKRITDIYESEGSDAWFTRPASDFLGPDYNPDDYAPVIDIVDVWFESGVTQAYVLESRPELRRPADLYLEGSDQHRGWFRSSLLVGCGTRGDAPYKNVLTHGFILDEKGYKMSKSQGNVVDPMKLAATQGADILRLWAALSDYTEDAKFGENILQYHADVYRRVRGTFCYLLGSLSGFDAKKSGLPEDKISDLDRYMLHRLQETDVLVRQCIADFEFQKLITTLHNFCARDLSAFYFDICKDALYCEAVDSDRRRGVLTTLDHIFTRLCHWLAPFLCFTCEEAWLSYKGLTMDDVSESIHLSKMPDTPASWENTALAAKFDKIIAARGVVTGALEVKRAAKEIGASLEASPVVHVADAALADILKSVPFDDICITSGIAIRAGIADGAFSLPEMPGLGVTVEKASGEKCARCWKYTADVGRNPQHAAVCARCAAAVANMSVAA